MKINKEFLNNLAAQVKDKQVAQLDTMIDYHSNQNVLVEVQDLKQSYKKKNVETVIFDHVSFNIYEGDRIALMGANGAGKTTIVEIISDFKKPTSGKVIKHFDQSVNVSRQIGVQFQDLSFPGCLTVYDIIKFTLEIDTAELNDAELMEMIEVFQLKDIMNRRASKLSGGQQQRLNVLLSLVMKPKLLFLDEFTTGLDIAVRNNIKQYINKFCTENNITLVLISHDTDILSDMANRVVVLYDKKICIDLSMDEVKKRFGSLNELSTQYIR